MNLQAKIPAITMPKPSSHSQYCSRKPSWAALLAGWTIATGGGGATTGASCSTTGAGAATGAGGAALGATGWIFATLFFAFLTSCLGAGCSATAAGAGCASATTGFSATTGAWLDGATATGSGFVAHAESTNAENSRVTGIATLDILDMEFPQYVGSAA